MRQNLLILTISTYLSVANYSQCPILSRKNEKNEKCLMPKNNANYKLSCQCDCIDVLKNKVVNVTNGAFTTATMLVNSPPITFLLETSIVRHIARFIQSLNIWRNVFFAKTKTNTVLFSKLCFCHFHNKKAIFYFYNIFFGATIDKELCGNMLEH